MSALMLERNPLITRTSLAGKDLPKPLAFVAAVVGALAPWLLLVGAHGGLARSAASCLAGAPPI